MNCLIELINQKNNKSIKKIVLSGTYSECENQVTIKNQVLIQKNTDKKWILTNINI